MPSYWRSFCHLAALVAAASSASAFVYFISGAASSFALWPFSWISRCRLCCFLCGACALAFRAFIACTVAALTLLPYRVAAAVASAAYVAGTADALALIAFTVGSAAALAFAACMPVAP